MKLYDTAKKDYVNFEPSDPVSIYVCGITPYDSAHLGHIFTFMTYDLLQRRLEDLGHTVHLVRNITDVDEPIYVRAKELGISYTELAERETKSFDAIMVELNFRPLFAAPKASDYINKMAMTVKQLLDSGFGYYVDNDVYFDVSKCTDFEDFSGYSQRLLKGLSAMRGGDLDRAGKRQPLDFLLWKSISDSTDPAQWDSVVGRGRPGWHIECSVMSSELLGLPIDIHGGDSDLIYPHHSAEIAQSQGMGLDTPAKYWVHVAPLLSDCEKMSKSLGNLVFAKDLLKDYRPPEIRLALMHYHHRIGGEWQPGYLDEARKLLTAIDRTSTTADSQTAKLMIEKVRTALDNDLNNIEVIEALNEFADSPKTSDKPNPDTVSIVKQTLTLLGLN